jgi:hypothetical protein
MVIMAATPTGRASAGGDRDARPVGVAAIGEDEEDVLS